jgi:DNA-binding MarR family transcriptional regulator
MELMWRHKGDFVASMAEEGLSPMQAHALRLLEQPRAMSELAEVLWCDASNVTGIIDRLEARGLVERRPSPQDRRVKRLSLTEEGEHVRRRVVARMHRPPAELAALPRDDQRALRSLLARALGRS